MRNQRISSIRASLRTIPIISKNTTKIELKLRTNTNEQRCSTMDDDQKSTYVDEVKVKSMEEIHQTTLFEDKYVMGEKIGQGANGFVSKCTKIKSGKLYAVKSSIMDDQHVMGLKQNFLSIHAITHPNIVQYQALYLDMRKKLCLLVMQYINLPSLDKVKLTSPDQLKQIAYQLLDSVKYLHSKNISHRDIKPQNILYDAENKTIRVIDFGTARQFIRRSNKLDMLTITGTLFYRAPQMFTGGGYDQKVDIWAVGVLIYKLVCGKTPFESSYLSDTINNIIQQSLTFQQEVWNETDPTLKNLIRRMLKKDRNERLSASQCLRDAWFYSLQLGKLNSSTGSHRQLPLRIVVPRQSHKHKTFFPSKGIQNAQTPSELTACLTQIKHNIDGEDCFVFDSEEQQSKQPLTAIRKNKQRQIITRKRSGSICI